MYIPLHILLTFTLPHVSLLLSPVKLTNNYIFLPAHSLPRLSPSFFLYYTILPFFSYLRFSLLFVRKLSDDSCGEIKRARNRVNAERRRRNYPPSRKGGFSTTKRAYARGFSREFAMFVAELCTHEATRGCRVSCFIGHLSRVRPTLCRRARGTRAGKSYDCREAPRAREEGGGGDGGY